MVGHIACNVGKVAPLYLQCAYFSQLGSAGPVRNTAEERGVRFASFPQLALLLKGEAPQVDSCATLFEIDKSVNNERIGDQRDQYCRLVDGRNSDNFIF